MSYEPTKLTQLLSKKRELLNKFCYHTSPFIREEVKEELQIVTLEISKELFRIERRSKKRKAVCAA